MKKSCRQCVGVAQSPKHLNRQDGMNVTAMNWRSKIEPVGF
jgi:hypothetical protein